MIAQDQTFSLLVTIFVPFLVAALITWGERIGFLWLKVNQPTAAGICGGLLGVAYHLAPVYAYFNDRPPGGTAGDFITAGVLAGLAGAGVKAIAKDVQSGAITVNSKAGVESLRNPTSGDTIGNP